MLQESSQAEIEIQWEHSWSDHCRTLGQYSGLLWSEIKKYNVTVLQKHTLKKLPSYTVSGYWENGNNKFYHSHWSNDSKVHVQPQYVHIKHKTMSYSDIIHVK